MTVKDKKELVSLLTNQFRNDINKVLDRTYDLYEISMYDDNMKKIFVLEKNVKTIKDIFELEELYEKCEHYFEALEKEYIMYSYLDKPIELKIDKDTDIKTIFKYFQDLRSEYNDKIKKVSARFIFKNFHDYVDKVWEEL